MKRALTAIVIVLAAGCGSSAKPPAPPAPEPETPPTAPAPADVAVDCADQEHQVELCRASCAECAGSTPGNSCNVCAEGCAERLWCARCGATEGCE